MKTIIAGSRDITDYKLVEEAVNEADWEVTGVVSGGARGVDILAVEYAGNNNLICSVYPADWEKYGKRAGYLRNCQMADQAEALIAITNGSKGTGHMINIAKERGLKVHVKWIR